MVTHEEVPDAQKNKSFFLVVLWLVVLSMSFLTNHRLVEGHEYLHLCFRLHEFCSFSFYI